jgi:CPA2 family monovalent cation:H+ antiporter-2
LEIPLLKDLLLIFALAIVVLLICHRVRVATTVGFLLTGVLAGPQGLGLIKGVKDVEILAEVGVILLLFTIGVEFSLQNLFRIKRLVFFGGSLQVSLTVLATFLICKQFGMATSQGIFVGFLVSLSSTAIVLKLYQERAEMESPHGQTGLGILIFQDIAVVPMMLFTPFLAGKGLQMQGAVWLLLVKGLALFALVIVCAKYIVPEALYQVVRTRSRELFSLTILVMCFGVAFITHELGLSLALGAFLAGLIISETEYAHETIGNVIPFRDVFTSLFFVSIGMLLDVRFLIAQPGRIGLTAMAVMGIKSGLMIPVILVLGLPLRTSVLTGLALCQVGEFSFILFMRGAEVGLLGSRFYQLFLNVSVLTMGVTPFMIALAPRLADAVMRVPLPRKLKAGFYGRGLAKPRERLKEHLVIVGYGFNGRNLAAAAKAVRIPYVVVEMNPQTVREERKKGEPVHFGDASQQAVLESADIKHARVVVVVISDPVACRRITFTVRKENPKAHIIVRTRFVSEMQSLYDLGANEVIPEEFETSIEISSRVLGRYLVPRSEIETFVAQARAGGYQMFRSPSKDVACNVDLKVQLPGMDVGTIRVDEKSVLAGKSLSQIELRRKHGATLLAISRDGAILSNPDGETTIQARDVLLILANPENLAKVSRLSTGQEESHHHH